MEGDDLFIQPRGVLAIANRIDRPGGLE